MTEEDAKKKWCPLARVSKTENWHDDFQIAVNRDSEGNPGPVTMCIGSGCMAWRYETREEYYTRIKQDEDEDKNTQGYCGAFGKS